MMPGLQKTANSEEHAHKCHWLLEDVMHNLSIQGKNDSIFLVESLREVGSGHHDAVTGSGTDNSLRIRFCPHFQTPCTNPIEGKHGR